MHAVQSEDRLRARTLSRTTHIRGSAEWSCRDHLAGVAAERPNALACALVGHLSCAAGKLQAGVISGNHPRGSYDLSAVDAIYVAGRTRPDVVAPMSNTSAAAPVTTNIIAKCVDQPVPHFGVVLEWSQWEALAERLKSFNVTFVIEPHIRFLGQVGE